MEIHPAVSVRTPRSALVMMGIFGAIGLPALLGSCGKKDEAKPAPTAEAPTPPPAVAAQKPSLPTPEPAGAETLQPLQSDKPVAAAPKPAAEPAPSSLGRAPGTEAVWQRWDHAAEGLRELGLTVRVSDSPQRMEIVVGPRPVSPNEARLVVKNVYRNLGGGAADVTFFNQDGSPLAQAIAGGIQ